MSNYRDYGEGLTQTRAGYVYRYKPGDIIPWNFDITPGSRQDNSGDFGENPRNAWIGNKYERYFKVPNATLTVTRRYAGRYDVEITIDDRVVDSGYATPMFVFEPIIPEKVFWSEVDSWTQ